MPDRHGNIDWATLVPIRGRARYQAGTIFAPGKVFEECGIRIVLEGTVRFSILAADGKEQVLAYLPKGSIFGEQAALGRVPLHGRNNSSLALYWIVLWSTFQSLCEPDSTQWDPNTEAAVSTEVDQWRAHRRTCNVGTGRGLRRCRYEIARGSLRGSVCAEWQ